MPQVPQNGVLSAIHNRRSTRKFLQTPVDTAQLDAILDAAIWAPSGSNSQSWLFTAIQNQPALDELNRQVRMAFARWTPDDDYPAKHGAKKGAEKEDFHFFYHAPVLVIASNRPGYQNAMADCALGLENIFLAAESLGLGSCYINPLFWLRDDAPLREFLQQLGIPREHVVCGAAAIGHIAAPSPVPKRKPGTVKIIGADWAFPTGSS